LDTPDGADPALLEQALHGSPGAVVIVERLVDEVEVDVIEAEAVQRSLEGSLGGVVAGVLHPQLGGDEQVVAGDAALGDGAPDRLLVLIGGGGVDVPAQHP